MYSICSLNLLLGGHIVKNVRMGLSRKEVLGCGGKNEEKA